MNNDFTFREGTWDRAIFNCITLHNEYKLPTRFKDDDLIIDIGAHIGAFSYACLQRGAGQVYAYEASKPNFELAYKNLSSFKKRAKVHFNAVWRSDTKVDSLTFNDPVHTINTGGGNVWGTQGTEKVPVITLDQILSSIQKRVRLLKLDCEGSEFPILFTSKQLHKVDEIVGEYHEFGGKYNPMSIPSTMKIQGYTEFTVEVLLKFLQEQGFKTTHKRSRDGKGDFVHLGHFSAKRS